MKIVLRVVSACLLALLTSSLPVHAGGDLGFDPYEVGEKYFLRRDYRLALKYYRQALDQNDARAHYGLGRVHEATGKTREALRQYELFMALSLPDADRNDAAGRARSLADRLKRDTARSAELLEEGKRLLVNGKYREAEKVLLQAAAGDESQPETHFCLGEVYLKLEAYAKATAEYRKAKGYY